MSNIRIKKKCAECSIPFPHLRVRYKNGVFFSRKDVWRISMCSLTSSASGAARATEILACSNLEGKNRSFGSIPSNIQVIYHLLALVVISMNVRRFLRWNVGFWREAWESTIHRLRNPLQRRIVVHRFCKFGRSAQRASRSKLPPAHTKKQVEGSSEALNLLILLLFLPLFS